LKACSLSVMATYVAESDTYAGWSTGRNFGYFGLVAGAVALAGWAWMYGHLHGFEPANLSDQLFIAAMTWIGGGVFAVMSLCVYGSILLSGRSRGTVVIDDKGVLRQIGKRSQMLAWDEIEGFVPLPYGGVTLVSRKGSGSIVIPRTLDDYRGCLAELQAKGLESLPSSRLRVKGWRGWWRQIGTFASTYAFLLSYSPELPACVSA
jgi:hypothetical protein